MAHFPYQMLQEMRRGGRPDEDSLASSTTANFNALSPILLIATVVIAWLAFGVLSIWFVWGDHRLDRILLLGLAPPTEESGHAGRLTGLAWSLTALGSPELVALFSGGVLGFLLLAKRLKASLFVIATVGGGALLGYILKGIFGYFRPHHAALSQDVMLNTSFPSGHALLAALFFLSSTLLLARQLPSVWMQFYLSAFAVAVIAMVGGSRVYLGLHWPSDVIAGWLFGIGWIAFVLLLPKKMTAGQAIRAQCPAR